MNDIIKYGDINIAGQVVICGHPGLCAEKYYFDLQYGGYSVFVKEIDNNNNNPRAVEIQIIPKSAQWSQLDDLLINDLSNDNHGGILIAQRSKIEELGDDFENGNDDKLWNYFSNGLCLRRSSLYKGWISNCDDGNIIFVPSCEFYRAYTLISGDGIGILCDQEHSG